LVPDHQVYMDDLHLGGLAEPLGFDGLWSVEHHFTPYTMIPDVVQLLTYFAGRTSRIELGTAVIVLPWHDPVRVAEQVAMLDIMLQGRRLNIGLGRGAGRVEFEGFRTSMAETRGRFTEAHEIIRRALSQPRFSFEGEYYQIPEMSIRPQPLSTDLADRMYCAWQSPETLEIAARAGLRMLFIVSKPLEEYGKEVEAYNAIRAEIGLEPRQPTIGCLAYCAESEDEALDGAMRYMNEYSDSASRHYEFADAGHFRAAGSYDYYAQLSEQMQLIDEETRRQFAIASHIWGTPEQCIEKLRALQRTTSAEQVLTCFKYDAMPLGKAERSMRLFAEKVLPAVHADPAPLRSAAAVA
jgi:alkanesulfonate monooxygenase SsuD/methylene tetrahydromethanopterin reductase-like flavin-dependent oxidoreductase (luciferase family)